MTTRHVIVHGTVQGVFYRASAEQEASRLGVSGWVGNRDDGTVEMVVEGEERAVEQMLDWARGGPSQAEVTDLTVSERPDEGHTGFDQR